MNKNIRQGVDLEVNNIEAEEVINIDMIVLVVLVLEIEKEKIINMKEDHQVEEKVRIIIIGIKKEIEDLVTKEEEIVETPGIDLMKA